MLVNLPRWPGALVFLPASTDAGTTASVDVFTVCAAVRKTDGDLAEAINKAWEEATIKDDPVTQSNAAGTITFAQTGSPNSRSTQVFVNLGDNAALDHSGQGFAPFGTIISGMDVVQGLYGGYADQPTNHQDEITNQGNAYLQKNFPKLDSIKSAKITSPAPAPAASTTHKSAAAAPKQ